MHYRPLSSPAPLALVFLLPLACGDNQAGSDSDASSTSVGSAATTAGPSTGSATDSSTATGSSGSMSGTGTSGTTGSSATDPTTGVTTGGETTSEDTTGGPFGTTEDPTTGEDTNTTGPPVDECKVNEDMENIEPCTDEAPPESFEAVVQWSFTPPPDAYSQTTPLVANMTDDNDDGEIDLCDIPDVLLLTFGVPQPFIGRLHVLDGATGAEHFEIAQDVMWRHTPAIGDIDNDGLVEIVAQSNQNTLYAFENDGTLKWESAPVNAPHNGSGPSVALADVDNDGDVEIIYENFLLDHEGTILWSVNVQNIWSPSTVAADLDGDGDMELIHPSAAFHHDGTMYYSNPALGTGHVQVADLDDDPEPEVLVTSNIGISLLEHDGTVKYMGLQPVGNGGSAYARPATIHDFDGDGVSEFAVSSSSDYSVYEGDASVVWTATVKDSSGSAAGTAFDFLGDGFAEAMYGDEDYLWVYDEVGAPLVQEPRASATIIEYPVVADVDNDGSAEILVVSSPYFLFNNEPNPHPALQVFGDVEDRWIQARRIWNQHTYHITNVREDGTIPQFEPPHWQALNTFRTNAQIEGGGVCIPIPE